MNVLFYQDTLGVSGGEIWIVDAATRLRERGHGVSFACPSGSWVERQAEARAFAWVDFSPDRGLEAHHRWVLTDHIAEHDVDLVFCSIPGMRSEVALLDGVLREVGRGSIVVRLGVSPGEDALAPARLGVGFSSVSGIIAVSQDVKAHLVTNVSGITADDVHVIYNGVDTGRFSQDQFGENDRAALRDRLEVPQDHLLITSIGRLDPVKNLPMLIESAERVLRQRQDVTFLIAGDGAQSDLLQSVVARKLLSEHFRFPGFVDDIPKLMHASDVLAHCAFSEGVPNVVLEAMAAGLAIVATDVGGVREVVEPDITGVLVPSGDVGNMADALMRLAGEKARRLELGQEALRTARSMYSREKNIDEVEQFLARLAQEDRRYPNETRAARQWMALREDTFARPVIRIAAAG